MLTVDSIPQRIQERARFGFSSLDSPSNEESPASRSHFPVAYGSDGAQLSIPVTSNRAIIEARESIVQLEDRVPGASRSRSEKRIFNYTGPGKSLPEPKNIKELSTYSDFRIPGELVLGGALLAASSSQSKLDRRDFLRLSALGAGTAILSPASLAAAEKPKEKKEIKLQPVIRKEYKEFVRKNPDTFIAYELLQSPAYFFEDEDLKIIKEKQDSWFAAGAGKNPALKEETFEELTKLALKDPNKKLAFGIFQNQNFKVTKEIKESIRKSVENGDTNGMSQWANVIAMHPTWIVEEKDRELSQKGRSDWFKYWITQNPTFFDGLDQKKQEEYQRAARTGSDIWYSEGLAQNPKYKFAKDDYETAYKNLSSWFTHGLMRNKKLPVSGLETAWANAEKNSYLAMGLTRTPYYFGTPGYSFTDKEKDFIKTKELVNSILAYKIAKDKNHGVNKEDKEFARKSIENANSAFAIGLVQNPQFTPDIDDITWILSSKTNANTAYAYEVGKKLTRDQIHGRLEIKKDEKTYNVTLINAVRGAAIDLAFAEGVTQNHNYSVEGDSKYAIADTDYKLVRGDKGSNEASLAFTKHAIGLIQNIYYGEIKPEDKEAAKALAKGSFDDKRFAYLVAKNLSAKQITKDDEAFIIENPLSMYTKGLLENNDFNPSDKFNAFVRNKDNLKKYHIQDFTKSIAFKLKDDDKKLAMENPDSYFAYGLGQNQNWGKVTAKEKEWIMKNHNTMLARALAQNLTCYEIGDGKKELEFAMKEPNSWLTNFLLEREDFPFNYEAIKFVADNLGTKYSFSVRFNPTVNVTGNYRRER